MASPGRRFGKPLSMERYLTLPRTRTRQVDGDGPTPEPEPDYKQNFSFDRPGLTGGTYEVNIGQGTSETERSGQDRRRPGLTTPSVKQQFVVQAPRFELPADAVYSVYPEQDQEATHDTLPHIVFSDCMLPWEQIGSHYAEQHHDTDDYAKSRVPWFGLLVFTADELRLDDSEKRAIFAPTSIKETAKQSESLAVSVPMTDLLLLDNGIVKLPFGDIAKATKPDTRVIFPKAALFNRLFSAYDNDGKRTASPADGPDLSRHRFLAHMMRINTSGMADADRDENETSHELSVVIANRIGPVVGDKASQMIVHLVSLQDLESLSPFPLPEWAEADPTLPARVALISLHSWSYTCLPPDSLDVRATFERLAAEAQMLKPIIPPQQDANPNSIAKRIISRLTDGYTVVRSRTSTGEETAAMVRGPLTPNLVPQFDWNVMSDTGSSLQILDPELGMMDLTFSTAWNLGRTLALADRAFTISLTRVRHQILKPATTRRSHTREDLFKSLKGLIQDTVPDSQPADMMRWVRSAETQAPDLSYTSMGPFSEMTMQEAASETAKNLGSRAEGRTWVYAPPYDELKDAASPDWKVIIRFVLDLYYLINVPSHYLLPDPSQVPHDSLRFFFIDHNWIDALVDGALSLGNQGGTTDGPEAEAADVDDPGRRAIKSVINRLFEDPTCHRPPVPRFGFFLRSAVVAQFPDLQVSVDVSGSDSGEPYLLHHEALGEETMLGLFSEAAIKDGLHALRFQLPGHQQFFSVGSVAEKELVMNYKRQYAVEDPKDPELSLPVATIRWPRNEKGRSSKDEDPKAHSQVFVWGSKDGTNDLRLLLVEKLAADVQDTVHMEMEKICKECYTEKTATSATVAMQLSSPAWQLQIGPMKAFTGAAAQKAMSSITGRLSYREARPSSLEGLDASTVLPPKAASSFPASAMGEDK